MKPTRKILLGSLILVGLQFGLGSCLTGPSGRTGVYYGPQPDPWFRDDSWVDGHRWYGGPHVDTTIGIYIHPPRTRR
jgi:hypothetical protein